MHEAVKLQGHSTSPDLVAQAQDSLDAVETALLGLAPDAAERFARALRGRRRVLLCGAGREALVLQALAARLNQAGLASHLLEGAAPPLVASDLLIVSAGAGEPATARALLGQARAAGARSLLFTCGPDPALAGLSDTLLALPAPEGSPLPVAALYTLTLWLLTDLLCADLGGPAERAAPGLRVQPGPEGS